ncbi:cob(I)yrinic acid a,c-diamide adenosyltransferase [Parageobacillus thermoglucosidasius]|uniref:Corrinoid adenosyltransferase n=1 Tax=Parageobacillus thermoglucosidasius TaxID=1426 RepID=A0AAN0YR22_PARTM|nr:cob(I)yrinic acid a,c-diamide adenosyltransferase [Parageobacillus thermoglucosidasius]KYD18344.1 Cob(I)alamin adenosyltransferase PduO [Anoxybacillus flavithermus]ALF10864.1 cobalamin adenosyltransferase [Parageobacillus thermoglucosidasius]ANZ30941.1 ATP:cob(I)alamin adenosyltransferase [Parageobacillus thermoglucosidasius]APM81678.1 ATP:cob(I)alamin adenosyltransferase [Parageobacillus thermoglucosidasius]EID44454.1 cobalamin adenosyltransferase [Parageobacillus thermoglucosidasius TNO-0
MAIYTKKGDKGETGLLGGSRISKDSLQVACYGTLDEANAALGVAYSQIENKEIKSIIRDIQKQLFVVGAELASDEKGYSLLKEKVSGKDVTTLEDIIDHYEKKLGPIHEFIIPGETTASSHLHLARAIIRRAERLIVNLSKTSNVRLEIIQFMNRLSDALFMLARAEVYYSMVEGIKEKVIEKIRTGKTSHELTLEMALKMANVAERKAAEIGVPIVFTAVDASGNIVLLHRMKGALLASLDLSPNKAYTAVALKMATHELAPLIQPGRELYGIQVSNQNKIVTFGGGYPLKINDEIIGGIGVSGGSVEEDMEIAQAVLTLFEEERGGLH